MVVEVPVGAKLQVWVGLKNNLDERLDCKVWVGIEDPEKGHIEGWEKTSPSFQLPSKTETTQVSNIMVQFDNPIPYDWVDKTFDILVFVYDPKNPERRYGKTYVEDAFKVIGAGKEVEIVNISIKPI